MILDGTGVTGGFCGGHLPRAGQREALRDWALARGATRLIEDDPWILALGGGPDRDIHPCEALGLKGVVHGEIYPQPGLAESLGEALGTAVGADPASLVAAAYRARGPAGLAALDGLFACALWDRERGETLLYRDGSSARGLYHQALGGDALLFASRIDHLTALPFNPVRIGRAGLHEFLRFLDISPPHTLYQDLLALEPGGLLRHRAGDGASETSVTPACAAAEGPTNLAAASAAVEQALVQALEIRLDDSGPVGCFLSGGIDSSLLCALGARLAPERLIAVTVGFTEAGYDEAGVAGRVAGALGLDHLVLRFDWDQYEAAFDELMRRADLPFSDPAGVPTLLACERMREIAPVVLDGTGADTLFGVMPARHTRISIEYIDRLPRALRTAVGRSLARVPGFASWAPLFDFDDPQSLLIRWHGWTPAEIAGLTGHPAALEETRFYQLYRRFPRAAHFERYSALLGSLPDDRIRQAAELHGQRVRFPYWDPRVVAAVQALPMELRYRPDQPKPIQAEILRRHLPQALWDVPKHGFDFPFLELLRRHDHRLLRRHLDPARLREAGLVDPDMVARYSRRFEAGETRLAFRLWALIVLHAWLAAHPH